MVQAFWIVLANSYDAFIEISYQWIHPADLFFNECKLSEARG